MRKMWGRQVVHAVATVAIAPLLVLAGCNGQNVEIAPSPSGAEDQEAANGATTSGMDMSAEAPRVPPVFGYYGGEPVFFVHTEVSDAGIGETLETMMGSPVPVVASLARIPDDLLSPVYVFENGVIPRDGPAGPLGFQPDVFATAPGDDGYTPLRKLIMVSWIDESDARVLTSADQVVEAERSGEVQLDDAGVVVNMPLLTWPGGQR